MVEPPQQKRLQFRLRTLQTAIVLFAVLFALLRLWVFWPILATVTLVGILVTDHWMSHNEWKLQSFWSLMLVGLFSLLLVLSLLWGVWALSEPAVR